MKKQSLTLLALVSFIIFTSCKTAQAPTQEPPATNKASSGMSKILPNSLTTSTMKITSSAFLNNQKIPSKYTCDGDDLNPALTLSDIPENAQSLVLIVDDPDAPMGTWVHWTVFNIAPKTTEITENSIPTGATQGQTSWNRSGYGGPCPPSGTHRYFFKLYALDTKLDLKETAKSSDIENKMEGHILAKAELIGLYSRT